MPPAVPFVHRLRVYWEDTDAGGIVYYANYLRYFERARSEWMRAIGFGQHDMREATGAIFVVADLRMRYLKPARLDDEIAVGVELREAGRASLLFRQHASRGGERLAEGEVRVGCVDAGTFRPTRIPTGILSAIA